MYLQIIYLLKHIDTVKIIMFTIVEMRKKSALSTLLVHGNFPVNVPYAPHDPTRWVSCVAHREHSRGRRHSPATGPADGKRRTNKRRAASQTLLRNKPYLAFVISALLRAAYRRVK